ncbi:MAG: acireductone synthase [Acidobacteriota bacterium]|nr:acireductone synthase [Acidobacteriota bacterium]
MDETAESFADYLLWLMDEDRKSTPLKSLQGKIWQTGYESGELKSEVFDDVVRAFERWKSENKTIAIYSSGSVLAQQLLFRYTNFGDLTYFISNCFDTETGAKRDAESYRKIASALGFSTETLAFVSDISEELDAAKKAGFQTFLAIRQGNKPINHKTNHQPIHSFDEIL